MEHDPSDGHARTVTVPVRSFDAAGDRHVVMDLPRAAADVDLRVVEGALTVRGSAPTGDWRETVELPAGVADRPTRARLNNGVLEVVFTA